MKNLLVPANGPINAQEELDKSSPSEIDVFTERMDVNEREIKALKKANERFQELNEKLQLNIQNRISIVISCSAS